MRGDSSLPTRPERDVEFDILLCCASGRSPDVSERLGALLNREIDWWELLTRARRHKLIPLLHWHLERVEEGLVPAEARSVLKRAFMENMSRQMRNTGELLQILSLFEEHGIEAVPYKGPILAMQLYGDLSLRESVDLDIVVRRDHIDAARDLLIAKGYRGRVPLDEGDRRFMLRARYAEELDSPGGVTVELHWAFTNGDVYFPLTLDDLLPRLEQTMLAGVSVSSFAKEDLLLILCVHGAKHLWNRLEWIAGVAELLRGLSSAQWASVLERARQYGTERTLLLGVSLAHQLLGAAVPPEIAERGRSDRQLPLLIADVKWLLADNTLLTESAERFGSLHHDLFHFRLRERVRDQLRFLFYRFTTPSQPQKWVAVPVGRTALPLHAVTRPLQVMTKLVPALWWYAVRRKPRDLHTAGAGISSLQARSDGRTEVRGADRADDPAIRNKNL